MSHYLDFKTSMTDVEALKRALTHMPTNRHRNGIPDHAVEIHDKPANLYGYMGDQRPQKAEVVIRRKDVERMSNDVGFAKQSDGTYKAIVSEYDKGIGFNEDWLKKLGTYYNYEKSKIELEARNVKYTETKDKQGRLQLHCTFKGKTKGLKINL